MGIVLQMAAHKAFCQACLVYLLLPKRVKLDIFIKTKQEFLMKKMIAILSLVSISTTVFGGEKVDFSKCEKAAKSAAVVFQNNIVEEITVDQENGISMIDQKVISSDEVSGTLIEYTVKTDSLRGGTRDTAVVTDIGCNVQSTSRR